MSRNATTIGLLALAGSAGLASAQVFIPMNAPGKNYNEGRTNTAARGMVSYQGRRDNGDPVAGSWEWGNDTFHEMPQPTDDLGNALQFDVLGFRPGPERGPGDPIKGINVGLIKKPVQHAAVWDTRDGAPGFVYELPNSYGASSWATGTSVGGGVIGGALYGDLDGAGVSRHAAVWIDGGDAQLLPTPAGTRSSEVWDVTPSGEIACGWVSETAEARTSAKAKMADKVMSATVQYMSAGIVRVVEPDVADAESMMFTRLSDDGEVALTWSWNADGTSKGGLYDLGSETYTLLDGGDINGDGQIDLADRHDSDAMDFSIDGTVIGGSYTLPGGAQTAAVWFAGAVGYEMHDLSAYLGNLGSSGQDGWHLVEVTGVSDDGRQLSGWGYNPDGLADVWVAVIPAPGASVLLGAAGLLALGGRRR